MDTSHEKQVSGFSGEMRKITEYEKQNQNNAYAHEFAPGNIWLACGRSSAQTPLGAASVSSTRLRGQVDRVMEEVKAIVLTFIKPKRIN